MFFFHKMHEKRLAGWSFYGKKIKLKCKQVPGVICVLLLYTKMQCNSSPWHLAGCHCNIDKYVPLRCFFRTGQIFGPQFLIWQLSNYPNRYSKRCTHREPCSMEHQSIQRFQVTKRKVSGLPSLAKYKSASTKGTI
jgi:hypothetical protein